MSRRVGKGTRDLVRGGQEGMELGMCLTGMWVKIKGFLFYSILSSGYKN